LSPHLAHAVRELSNQLHDVQTVVHLIDKFARNAPDLEWIPALSDDGPWCVVSVDRFKKYGAAEREALRRAGHTVFLLEPQWLKHAFWLQSERFVRWWPQIVAQARLVSGGAFIVPWATRSSAKFKAVKL